MIGELVPFVNSLGKEAVGEEARRLSKLCRRAAAAAAAAAVAAATVAAAERRARGASSLATSTLMARPSSLRAVEGGLGSLRFFGATHLDEAEALGATGVAVGDEVDRSHLAVGGEGSPMLASVVS